MITIDLKTALTDEAIEAARPHVGACNYAAPCIIGAMVPPDHRRALDKVRDYDCSPGPTTVDTLVEMGVLGFADSRQVELATMLQDTFDNGTGEDFERMVLLVREELKS